MLPEFKIDMFSGNYTNWVNFKDMFKSLVHENIDIPNIQELYYLRSCWAGEAAQVIASVTNNSDSYDVAWKLFNKTFLDLVLGCLEC